MAYAMRRPLADPVVYDPRTPQRTALQVIAGEPIRVPLDRNEYVPDDVRSSLRGRQTCHYLGHKILDALGFQRHARPPSARCRKRPTIRDVLPVSKPPRPDPHRLSSSTSAINGVSASHRATNSRASYPPSSRGFTACGRRDAPEYVHTTGDRQAGDGTGRDPTGTQGRRADPARGALRADRVARTRRRGPKRPSCDANAGRARPRQPRGIGRIQDRTSARLTTARAANGEPPRPHEQRTTRSHVPRREGLKQEYQEKLGEDFGTVFYEVRSRLAETGFVEIVRLDGAEVAAFMGWTSSAE